MKKALAILLVMMLAVFAIGCDSNSAAPAAETAEAAGSDLKIGVILVGDENEGYTYAHIEGFKKADPRPM